MNIGGDRGRKSLEDDEDDRTRRAFGKRRTEKSTAKRDALKGVPYGYGVTTIEQSEWDTVDWGTASIGTPSVGTTKRRGTGTRSTGDTVDGTP